MAIYIKIKPKPGIYFPRNSFITDGTPILVKDNTSYRVYCHSSGDKVSWYYRNGTEVTKSLSSHQSYASIYVNISKQNELTRKTSGNHSNEEFYCVGNHRTAWFGMFVNPS